MTKRTLADLKSAYNTDKTPQTQTFVNNYYPFWNMPTGQRAVLRFLPDRNENNPRGFLVEKVYHTLTINGEEHKVPCLSMYGEDCPICKLSQSYYKVKDEVNGKKYWKKRQYLGQALVIEDPIPAPTDAKLLENYEPALGKVRMIALGFQIYNVIKEAFGSDELEGIPYDFEEGYDFIIKKSEQGKHAGYTAGTKFANKQRSLTEAELAAAEEGMIDLSTLLPKNPGYEKVQAMLDAEMNGEEYKDPDDQSGDDDDDTPFTPAVTTKAPAKAPEASDASTNNVDDILATIRARRKSNG